MAIRWPGYLAMGLLSTITASSLHAKRANIPISRQVATADAIALVRIGAVRDDPRRSPRAHVAELHVLQSFRGPGRRSHPLRMEYVENREDAPRDYHSGETWLLFLIRSKAGRYAPVDWYRVHGDTVDFWPEAGRSVPLQTAAQRIRTYLRKAHRR